MNRPPFQPLLRDQTAWFQPLNALKRAAAAVQQLKPSDRGSCTFDPDTLVPYIWTGTAWQEFPTSSSGGITQEQLLGGDLRTFPHPTVQSLTFEDGAPFVVWQNRWWFQNNATGLYYLGYVTSEEFGSLQWKWRDDVPGKTYDEIFNP